MSLQEIIDEIDTRYREEGIGWIHVNDDDPDTNFFWTIEREEAGYSVAAQPLYAEVPGWARMSMEEKDDFDNRWYGITAPDLYAQVMNAMAKQGVTLARERDSMYVSNARDLKKLLQYYRNQDWDFTTINPNTGEELP